ncbi:TPA: hypothetical protein QDZ75_003642 [Stenotrophomonas maltophilia]|nr:hypothetical protein [Stenotrophomonas maltophilia]
MARQIIDTTTQNPGWIGDPGRIAFTKTNENFAELYGLMSQVQIAGHRLEYVDAGTLVVSGGMAWVPFVQRVVRVDDATYLSTGSIGANAWGHIYSYDDAGTGKVELSAVEPAAPFQAGARTKMGDTSRRYLGSIRTAADGTLLKFIHNWQKGAVDYVVDLNTPSLTLLANGSNPSVTTVSAATAVPVSCRVLRALVECTGGTTPTVIISTADVAGGAVLAFVRGGQLFTGSLILTSDRTFTYFMSGGGAATVWCTGYEFER